MKRASFTDSVNDAFVETAKNMVDKIREGALDLNNKTDKIKFMSEQSFKNGNYLQKQISEQSNEMI